MQQNFSCFVTRRCCQTLESEVLHRILFFFFFFFLVSLFNRFPYVKTKLSRRPLLFVAHVVRGMFIPLQKLVHAMNKYFWAIKIEKFQLKIFDIFLIFAQNIDWGYTLEPPRRGGSRRGGSNEYPRSMFWSKNKKNRYTLYTPVLLYKSGVQGGIHYTDMFS